MCISYSSHCCDEMPDKRDPRKEGLALAPGTGAACHVEKTGQWERTVGGHAAFAAREQMNAGVFYAVRDLSPWNGAVCI